MKHRQSRIARVAKCVGGTRTLAALLCLCSMVLAPLAWAAPTADGAEGDSSGATRAGRLAADAGEANPDILNAGPSRDLSPVEVVRIQLAALRANEATRSLAADPGIAAAFRFASPANRSQTGPLPRFARMIREGPYRLMLTYRQAVVDDVQLRPDEARVQVVLIGDRDVVAFVFVLSRQAQGECTGCWMTDAVWVMARPAASAMGPRMTRPARAA